MAAQNDDARLESRAATPDDLVNLCRWFNAEQVRYVIIGGMAMIQHGLMRLTCDIDVLVDGSPENVARIRRAMGHLPDNAVADLGPGDIREYGVVRIADEFMTDLMGAACGVDYEEAIRDAQAMDIKGVRIPFAHPATLLKTKQTHREKDALDRRFLEALLQRKN